MQHGLNLSVRGKEICAISPSGLLQFKSCWVISPSGQTQEHSQNHFQFQLRHFWAIFRLIELANDLDSLTSKDV